MAFIDADDLWAPSKIERQLQAMIEGGEKTGLVYSWFTWIDANSRIGVRSDPTFYTGEVLEYLFEGNFIGNGSSVLVRREALVAANGFDSGLRASGAQGCEDLLFYCRVAERYRFALVPEYLIGYRYLPNNMSSDMTQMFRSWMLVADEMAARHPDRIPLLNRGIRNYGRWQLRRALMGGQFGYFASIFVLLGRRNPLLALKVFMRDLPRDTVSAIWRMSRNLQHKEFLRPAPSFPIGDPNRSQ
jgi:hypothetical protein